jgi:HPt (histidine-containing phosphotransfer) domain-containing protein
MERELKYYNTDKLVTYNNPSFINKMIELFIKSSKEYLANISLALSKNDLVSINQLAHQIKPSLDLLNINSITQSIRDIENASVINNDLIDLINFTNNELHIVNQQMQNDYK